MADATYQPKVYRKQGATEFVVASGGTLTVESGGAVAVNGVTLTTAPTTYIVVATNGNDTTGIGSWNAPYLTLTKAFTVWTATRHTIFVLAGEYEEAAILTWPNIKGLSLVALGEVSVTNADAAASVLRIAPTYSASGSFEATIKGALNLAGTGAQIGLAIANAGMTKKLNVYIDGLSAEVGSSGDSIDIAGTVSGQAIRVYAKHLDLEGLLHFTANDAGSRLRVGDSRLMGGVTTTGAVAAECTLGTSVILKDGFSPASEWTYALWACVYATDADPAVYTACTDAVEQ